MKICILTTGHDPLDGRIFFKEVQSLLKNGYKDITIIAPYHKDYDEIDGVKIIGFIERKSNELKDRFRPLRDLYWKAKEFRADIYHCHEPDALVVGTWLKSRFNSKLIYDSHEYHPEHFAERYNGLKGKIVYDIIYKVEKYLARKADYVFTVNDELVEKFRKWGCKTLFLPNYALMKDTLNYSDDMLIKSLKDNGYTIGIFAGGIYEERGIKELITADKGLMDKGLKIAMIFIGWGNSDFVDAMKAYAVQNNLEDRVIFLGKKEHSYILNLLSQCDFGMINDYPEKRRLNSYNIKLFEYMQCSLPIYASDLPSFSNLIKEANCGVVADPLNPEDIAQKLMELCRDKNHMIILGTNGNKVFKEKYNWSIVEKQFINCYKELGDK